MSTDVVTIIQTGVANTASLVAAFSRLDVHCQFAKSPTEVLEAKALVLPGVGAFAAGMDALREQGVVDALCKRICDGAPTLSVCLGLQLLCEQSAESPGVLGLQILPLKVSRFPNTLRVPQLGWNYVSALDNSRYLQNGYAYFANSYHLKPFSDSTWKTATATYDDTFIAAIERGRVLGCQFHPELSGAYGLEILKRWYFDL